MLHKRRIKIQIILLALGYVAFLVAFLALFSRHYLHFHETIFRRTQGNLEVLDAIKKIETGLYIYQHSLERFATTGSPRWQGYLKQSQEVIDGQFKRLEDYNEGTFPQWQEIKDFTAQDPRDKLRDIIDTGQEGPFERKGFQQLFYLTRYNTGVYFGQVERLVEQRSASPEETLNLDDQDGFEKLLFMAYGQVRGVYTDLFWQEARQQSVLFDHNTLTGFTSLLAASGLLFVMVCAIFIQVFRGFRRHAWQREELTLLGVQDPVTGLFKAASARVMIAQDAALARRRGRAFALVQVQVGPIEPLKTALGSAMLDRFLNQAARDLQAVFPPGDAIYLIDTGLFSVICWAPGPQAVKRLLARFRRKFSHRSFLRLLAKKKIEPAIQAGVAVFGRDAEDYDRLMRVGMERLSDDFDDILAAFAAPVAPAASAAQTKPTTEPKAAAALMAAAVVQDDSPAAAVGDDAVAVPVGAAGQGGIATDDTFVAASESAAVVYTAGPASSSMAGTAGAADTVGPFFVSERTTGGIEATEITGVANADLVPSPAAALPENFAKDPCENFANGSFQYLAEIPAFAAPAPACEPDPVPGPFASDAALAQTPQLRIVETLPDLRSPLSEQGLDDIAAGPWTGTATTATVEDVPWQEIVMSSGFLAPHMPVAIDVPAVDTAAMTSEPDELPDVVAALTQDSVEPSWTVDTSAASPFTTEVVREGRADEFPLAHIPDIQVIKNASEDVIMVSFEREKSDLAERFRRRLRQSKKNQAG